MIILLFLAIFYQIHYAISQPNGCLYHKAKRIYEEKNERNIKLHAEFFIPPGGFETRPNTPFVNRSEERTEADILVIFMHLVKNERCSKKKTFQDCLNENAKCVPKSKRCLKTVHCNKQPKEPRDRFYRIGGQCNNLKYPKYGASLTPFKHILDPVYSDGIETIRKTVSGDDLPDMRKFGNELAEVANTTTTYNISPANIGSIFFGQVTSHDISFRAVFNIFENNPFPIRCCRINNDGPLPKKYINDQCIPLPIPADDPVYSKANITCLNHIRMRPTLDIKCEVKYAELENFRSSFLNLAPIYSDDLEILKTLRDDDGGFQMSPSNVLPLDGKDPTRYISGDVRVRTAIPLVLMHSIFHRSHNKIRDNLAAINPNWNVDRLFYECRRLLIAIYQSILYNEWLPSFIGKSTCIREKLMCGHHNLPDCDKYNDSIDPTTSTEFAHSAFRLAHQNIPGLLEFFDEDDDVVRRVPISDLANNTETIILEDDTIYSDFLNSILKTRVRSGKKGYSSEIRNFVFKTLTRGHPIGIDLLLKDAMRDRESGNAPYYKMFEWCSLGKIRTWTDIKPHFDEISFKLLRKYFHNVRDIDLLIGILLEKKLDTEAGPVATCIWAEQFYRYRYGDRFFFTNKKNPHPFSDRQIGNLNKMTFAKLICLATNIEKIQRRALQIPSEDDNDYVKCSDLQGIDFSLYKECTDN